MAGVDDTTIQHHLPAKNAPTTAVSCFGGGERQKVY